MNLVDMNFYIVLGTALDFLIDSFDDTLHINY